MIDITSISLIIFMISITISLYLLTDTLSKILVKERRFRLEHDLDSSIWRMDEKISELEEKLEEHKKIIDNVIKGIKPTSTTISKPPEKERRIEVKAVKKAGLSATEIEILKILMSGSKTSSEIRSLLKLSREHVARTLKKLYEKGFVERDESEKPFKYLIKEDMRSRVLELIGS